MANTQARFRVSGNLLRRVFDLPDDVTFIECQALIGDVVELVVQSPRLPDVGSTSPPLVVINNIPGWTDPRAVADETPVSALGTPAVVS